MTIQLTRATVIAGSVAAAGSQHTLDAATEAHLIYQGIATRVGADPDYSGPQPAFVNAAGTALVVGGAEYALSQPQVESPARIVADITTEFTSISGGTKVVDNSFGWAGRPSLKVMPTGSCQLYKATWAVDAMSWADAESVNFRFYIDDASGNPYIIFTFDNDGSWTNARSISVLLGGIRKGWNYVRLRFDIAAHWAASKVWEVGDVCVPAFAQLNGYEYTCTTAGTGGASQPTWPTTIGTTVADGTAVWTCSASSERHQGPNTVTYTGVSGSGARHTLDIRHIRFDIIGAAGKTLWFDRYLTVGGRTRPNIIFTFDNWTDEHHKYIRPAFNRLGLKFGTCFQDAALAGPPNGPTNYLANLNQLYADGHDILPNDITERPLANETYAVQYAGIHQNRETMRALGWTRGLDFFMLNSHSWNDNTLAALAADGVRFARAGPKERLFTFPEEGIDSPLTIGCASLDAYTVQRFKDLYDRAIEYGCTLVVYSHKLHSKAYAKWRTGTAVNTGETVQAYITRADANGWASFVGASQYSAWAEDYIEALEYLSDKVHRGLVDVPGPSRWMATVQRDPVALPMNGQMTVL